MQDKLRELIGRHCETLRGNVVEVARCIRTSDGPAIERAIAVTHQIKGSGGSIGFPQVSDAAAELERHLKVLAAGDGRFTSELETALADSLAKLERVAHGLVPQDSRLFNIDIDRLGTAKTRMPA